MRAVYCMYYTFVHCPRYMYMYGYTRLGYQPGSRANSCPSCLQLARGECVAKAWAKLRATKENTHILSPIGGDIFESYIFLDNSAICVAVQSPVRQFVMTPPYASCCEEK